MIVGETDRLFLRELTPDDAQQFFELNNDPEVIKYTGDDAFTSIKDAENFLKNYSEYENNGFGRWAVIRKEDDEFLGWCGLKMHDDNYYVDIGFRLFRKDWGNGYATEAARKSIDLGFNQFGLNEIIGRTAKANVRSVRILEKLGMTFFKKDESDGIVDAMYYRIKKN